MTHPVLGHTIQELSNLGTPDRGVSGNMEALRGVLYDTQTFTGGAAGTTSLTFFTAADTGNGFITNLPQGGQLPNPEFFMPYNVYVDVLGDPPADLAVWGDIYDLLFGTGTAGAPYAVFSYAGKKYPAYGGYPLSMFGGSGGPTGAATGSATTTLALYANNGIPGQSPFSFGMDSQGNSSITILPLKAFSWQIRWSAPVTLPSALASVQIRVLMEGTYYREIR